MNTPLRPPPPREVSSELRSRVLAEALRHRAEPDEPVVAHRRWRLATPMIAGLAAAAIVVAVVTGIQARHKTLPASGGHHPTQPYVVPHRLDRVDRGHLSIARMPVLRQECQQFRRFHGAGHVLASRRLRIAGVGMPALAYANIASGTPGFNNQFFCTPFGVVASDLGKTITGTDEPVKVVTGSQIGVRYDTSAHVGSRRQSDKQVYIDGAWLATGIGIASIEVRVDVDGVAGVWHATKRFGGYVFAAGWSTPVTSTTKTITVTYRAITTDRQVIALTSLDRTLNPASAPIKAALELP